MQLKYRFEDDFVVVICNNGSEFIIDKEDYPRIKEFTCYKSKDKNVMIILSREHQMSLTRFLTGATGRTRVKNGNPSDLRKENIYAGNIYKEESDYIVGYCFDNKTFIIDKEDFKIVEPHRWHIDAQGYVLAKVNGRTIKMHRLIMNVLDDCTYEIDHINRITTDNRKENLRLVDRSSNMKNVGISTLNTSGVKGVYWSKPAKKWCAQINNNGKRIYLGSYKSINEAAEARKAAETKYHAI